jgi:hypothetical protein
MQHGFDHGPPAGRGIQFYPGHGRLRPFKGGNFVHLCENDHMGRNSDTFTGQFIQKIWPPRQNNL